MAQAGSRSGTQRKTSNRSSGAASRSRPSSGKQSSARQSSARQSSARQSSQSSGSNGSSKATLVTGVATAAAGLIGGVVLGKRLNGKQKKVLGVAIPGTGSGLDGVAKQVKKA